MRRHALITLTTLVALGLAACDDDTATPPDAALDGAAPDARPLDAGPGEPDDGPGDPDLGPDADPIDLGPDAAPPVVPDEAPTDGAPDLPGVADLTAPPADGTARAGYVDDDAEKITGPDANCRLGDLRLDNDRIAVCIQAETSYGQFTFAGGDIIDAVPIDRLDGDYFREAIHTLSLGEISVERIGIVRDGRDGGPAIIRTEGTAGGALIIQGVLPGGLIPPPHRVVTEYRLAPGARHVDIYTWIYGGERSGSTRLVDLIYFGDQTRGYPDTVAIGDTPELLAAEADGVSYGWTADGPLSIFPLAVLDLPVEATQTASLSIRPGDGYLIRRRLHVGTGDVESVRPTPDDATPITLTGPPGLRVAITDAAGAVVTRALIGADGTRAVQLTPGDYTATTTRWPGGDISLPLTAEPDATLALDPPAPATLTLHLRDTDDRPIPARVLLDPGVGSRLEHLVDDATLELPPGDWTLTTTHGWHYSVDERTVTLEAGQPLEVTITLEQLIDHPGHAAGEFHQHASPSLDSEIPHADRIHQNLAEGVDFMVPSEHDVIYDYQSLARRLGLADRITIPLLGEEISPTFTHIGAYGLTYDPHAGAGGAVPLPVLENGRWRIRTVPELIAEARSRGARVIQINHGREDAGYFNHTDYTPETPIAELDPERFTADFDTMEVNNRSSDFCRLIADWLGLINQGLRPTAVGNSDTHSLGTPAGYPRNYLPALDPAAITADEVVAALTTGDVTVGGGAVIDYPDGPRPGSDISHDGDMYTLRVRVRTPPYARVDRLVVFANGRVVIDRPLDPAVEDITDLDEAIDIPTLGDTAIVVLALGDPSLAYIQPGRQVFALANPLFIDRDGDGTYTPPGPGAIDMLDLPACN